jgi:hypothetical protein
MYLTENEIHVKLQEGCDDVKAGRVQDAAIAFAIENIENR